MKTHVFWTAAILALLAAPASVVGQQPAVPAGVAPIFNAVAAHVRSEIDGSIVVDPQVVCSEYDPCEDAGLSHRTPGLLAAALDARLRPPADTYTCAGRTCSFARGVKHFLSTGPLKMVGATEAQIRLYRVSLPDTEDTLAQPVWEHDGTLVLALDAHGGWQVLREVMVRMN